MADAKKAPSRISKKVGRAYPAVFHGTKVSSSGVTSYSSKSKSAVGSALMQRRLAARRERKPTT